MNTNGINSDLVKRLRKRETAFQRYKIHFLFAVIFQIAVAGFFAVYLQKYHRLFQTYEMEVIMTSFFVCLIILSAFVGWIMILTSIRDWRGNPANLLLLEMIDRETNNEIKPKHLTRFIRHHIER